MNKKVLTLSVALLLSSALFNGVEAVTFVAKNVQETALAAGEEHAIGEGKYFMIHRSEYKAAPNTNSWNSNDDNYLVMADGALVWTSNTSLLSENPAAYWKIEDVTVAGEPMIDRAERVVRLVNGNNDEVLTLDANTHKLATATTADADKITRFHVDGNGNNNAILCYEVNGQKYILGDAGTTLGTYTDRWELQGVAENATAGGGTFVDFQVEAINEVAITADELNSELNGGFELNFTSKGEAYENLTGAEPFAGKLTAVAANTAGTQYYLRTSDGRYVILEDDYIGEADATLNGTQSAFYRGYNFKTVSEHAWSSANKDNGTFTIFKSYDFNNTDSLIVSLPVVNQIGTIQNGLNRRAANNESGLRVFVSTVNVAGVTSNLLTTIAYTKANDMLATVRDNAYGNAQMGALAPNIALGASNIIDYSRFIGKVWNITDRNGNVMSPEEWTADIDSWSQLFAPAEQVDLSKPEGQWLFNQDVNGYYFVNRESGERFYLNNTYGHGGVLRTTGTTDLYEVYVDEFAGTEWNSLYIREAANAELGKTENGYVKFDMNEEDNNGKYLSFETSLGLTAYVGKDADDNVILTTDKSQAIEFRVKQLSHDFTDHDGVEAPDTLHHYTTFLNYDSNNNVISDVDTLQFFHYALYENFSERYLKYDADTKRFELSDNAEDEWNPANNEHEDFDLYAANYAFVVKEKEDGTYVLVRNYAIDYDYCNSSANHAIQNNWNGVAATFDNIFEVNFGADAYLPEDVNRSEYANGYAHKAYMGTQNGGFLADMAYLYNYNDNDRITMENTDQTEYMYITGSQDTVKIALQSRPNYYLYEQGTNGTNFLGMEHVADVDDMAAALFVDTAYVRNNTYRPQYLLAVDAYHVEPVYDSHPDQTIPHLLHADSTYGRFLVNMVDSAYAYGINRNTNPYIWDTNAYYRLAFIDGIHTGDKLILNTEDAKTTINLGDNNDKLCTFAFRYVDADREGVIIETRYNTTTGNAVPVRGYLKFQNSVPVVTSSYDDAHIFTVDNETTEVPTANESITAEGAVSVVATDGAVIIKGAEGKNVVIATILGKVVANETVNSDNETIAVPAGIAVVSVDGESFKAVVK